MIIKLKTRKDYLDIIVLSIMYASASLGVLNREILDTQTLLFMKYGTIILGTIYFLLAYIKKYSMGSGIIAVPLKVRNWCLLLLWLFFSIVVIISQSYNQIIPFEGATYLIFNTIIFFIVIPLSLNNPLESI